MSWMRWAGWVALAWGALGCGAHFQRAECRRVYDDCTSACADRCDERGPAAETTEPETVNTWSMTCSLCEERCRAQANACDDRTARQVIP